MGRAKAENAVLVSGTLPGANPVSVRTAGKRPETRQSKALKRLMVAWLLAAVFTGLLAVGVRPVEASVEDDAARVDTVETGSIATATHAAGHAIQAQAAGSLHVPDSLSVLADRRLLVVLAGLGLALVWINRLPPSKKDGR
ncbi:hypothetical protein [Rhizobium paknamense]|uniref:Uncharacterized protein n=1 Tax=Rhizobium paknamense TaxID=1206817 RepID=A0ABU0I8I8_9HYPH|nr:hypothetical protein [Rhizobium paknamense]MDQ0454527.1 hypothetical protein [Rhizobium paknamense]